jgi:hypothetical protein
MTHKNVEREKLKYPNAEFYGPGDISNISNFICLNCFVTYLFLSGAIKLLFTWMGL